MNNPLVSVHMITYNHAPYIAEAIESVLMQKTNFAFELILGEDCSPDNTRQICQEYADKYPNIVKLLPADKNIGSVPNFMKTLKACKAKYVAICDGDDYWTDPNKLQIQTDFLENNPDYVACFHDGFIVNDDTGEQFLAGKIESEGLVDFENNFIIRGGGLVPTASFFFRNVLKDKYPDFLYNILPTDWAVHILLGYYGKMNYLKKPMCAYRRHAGNCWFTFEDNPDVFIKRSSSDVEVLKEFNEFTKGEFNEAVQKAVEKRYNAWFKKRYSTRVKDNWFLFKLFPRPYFHLFRKYFFKNFLFLK